MPRRLEVGVGDHLKAVVGVARRHLRSRRRPFFAEVRRMDTGVPESLDQRCYTRRHCESHWSAVKRAQKGSGSGCKTNILLLDYKIRSIPELRKPKVGNDGEKKEQSPLPKVL